MIKLYFGSPGSGKSTLAARIVYKYLIGDKHYNYSAVYTNFACKGALRFDSSDFEKFRPCKNSLVIIDEAGIDFNNRRFKLLKQSMIEFFKLHRHYKCDIVFLSQSWEDVDITIRRLADELIYIKKIGPFTRLRDIRKFVKPDSETHDIVEGYEFLPLWYFLFVLPPLKFKVPVSFFFRPFYYNMFDSYDAPEREERLYEKWENDFKPSKHIFYSWLLSIFNDLKNIVFLKFKKMAKQ